MDLNDVQNFICNYVHLFQYIIFDYICWNIILCLFFMVSNLLCKLVTSFNTSTLRSLLITFWIPQITLFTFWMQEYSLFTSVPCIICTWPSALSSWASSSSCWPSWPSSCCWPCSSSTWPCSSSTWPCLSSSWSSSSRSWRF